jgi:hypothetical protein
MLYIAMLRLRIFMLGEVLDAVLNFVGSRHAKAVWFCVTWPRG